ncbi:MAG: MGMT family protein [SAR324 cluster bacterium]|nr:MGMT family protein [SAR324 cluster bacterium]
MAEQEPLLFRPRVLKLISKIPAGRVTTYGQIALLAGYPRRARQVGYVLASLAPGSAVPWHRVINAQGRVSPRGGNSVGRGKTGVGGGSAEHRQQRLLRKEGVRFKAGRVDLDAYRWEPVIDEDWSALGAVIRT